MIHFQKLQTRLIALILAVIIPLSIGTFLVVGNQARQVLTQNANERLEKNNEALSNSVNGWMNQNLSALQQLVSLPSILTMNETEQKPILEVMAASYPHMYLVSTTDLNGLNVARSDEADLTDYQDRVWFQSAAAGKPLTFQTLIGRTSGEPALVVSTPIRNETGATIGVGMFAADLTTVAEEVKTGHIGETGFAYLVNEKGQVLAHPDPAFSHELIDYSDYFPVTRVLEGQSGPLEFTDSSGTEWHAYVQTLEYGWGLIVQQERSELLQSINTFQRMLLIMLTLLMMGIIISVWLTTRRTLRPIHNMTQVAVSVSQGDYSQTVPVESDDELGVLARAFNTMLKQITGFTTQVQRRNQALETSVEVSRHLSTFLDAKELVATVVKQVQNAFNYYHVHIYTLDDTNKKLIVAGGTGEAGAKMLDDGHSVPVGVGLVGRAAATKSVVLVPDVTQEKGWLANPLLPETKTETAVPIMAGDQLLGVLDVQHNVVGGLRQLDADMLQTVAAQVAIALRNATLFEQAQRQATQQTLVNEISQKIQRAVDLDGVLQVTAQELGRSLGVRRATVQLSGQRKDNGRIQEKN